MAASKTTEQTWYRYIQSIKLGHEGGEEWTETGREASFRCLEPAGSRYAWNVWLLILQNNELSGEEWVKKGGGRQRQIWEDMRREVCSVDVRDACYFNKNAQINSGKLADAPWRERGFFGICVCSRSKSNRNSRVRIVTRAMWGFCW